jgi:hypothetical protein
MLKSETQKLEVKKRQFNESLREWDSWKRKVRKRLTKEFIKGIKWLFCYQPKDDMDLILHILFIVSWLFTFWFAMRR